MVDQTSADGRRKAGRVTDPARGTSSSPAPSQVPLSGPFASGQVLGEAYEITGMLGVGGMGVVYEAHDALLDRMVAVKVPLRPEFAPALRNEAQALAAVRHPNVVGIHAIGHEGGVEFMVMERVFGMTLEDRIAEAWESQRPIPIDEALRLLVAIADGVSAIHGAGAAHRDIKSANVLISGDRVVLTDFGLVTPEIAVHPGGTIAGSADYMAPELILGTVQPGHGTLVDLYALGVVAFEVLASRHPYASETTHAVLLAHVNQPIPDVRSFRSDTPDDLAGLIHELLAKDPSERPESAEAVLWRLRAIHAELPQGSGAPPLSVMIVHHDVEVGSVLQRHLQRSFPGLAAELVADPRETIDRLKHKAPDIVVAELDLPGMNGVELAMNVLALPERFRPVLVTMSIAASHRDVDVLRSLGVRAFVPRDEAFMLHMVEVIADVRRERGVAPLPRHLHQRHR